MGLVSRIVKALTKAESEVTSLEQAVARWQSEADAKRQELAELEAAAGERILLGQTTPRELAVDKDELRFSVEGALAAARAAERQLQDARWALALAQAAELRDRAGQLRAQAEERQATVDRMVAELQAFEGGDWRPWQPSREDVVQAGAAGVPVAAPRTPLMLREADQLDEQAAAVEARVAAEKRRAAPIQPTATVRWNLLSASAPGGRSEAQVVCSVGEAGVGSATFQVLYDGREIHTVTLPDERGRRGWTKFVDGIQGTTVEVRCDSEVLASETLQIPAERLAVRVGLPGLLGVNR